MRLPVIPLLLALHTAGAGGADAVHWIENDAPPFHITSGPYAGQGGGDVGIPGLFAALKEFDHQLDYAPPARLWYEMSHNDAVCAFPVGRTEERTKIAVFSERALVVPGFSIITTDDRLPLFERYRGAGGAIDLARLAAAVDLVGGYVDSRPYPVAIAELIHNPGRQLAIQAASQAPPLYRQMSARRLDFVFSAAAEAYYYNKTLSPSEHFVTLPIHNVPAAVGTYFACSNGPVGRAVMARINKVMAEDAVWQSVVEPWRQWYNPVDIQTLMQSGNKDG